MHTPTPRRELAILLVAVLAVTALFAVPAGADDTATTRFDDTYSSISEAMVSYYAATSGQTLAGFLGTSSDQVAANLFGNAELSGPLASVASTGDLRRFITQQSVAFDLSTASSFDDLYTEFLTKAATIDGQVALAGTSFAAQVGSLQTPGLTAPEMPSLDGAVPAEALTFGLFYDQSVANLITEHPDVFGSVAQTGLGSQEASDAWKQAMLTAGVQTQNLTDRLPSPCIADLVSSMATGTAHSASSSCDPCATAGSFLHQAAGNLLDPSSNTVIPTDGTSGDTQGWLDQQLAQQNPSLAQQFDSTVNPNAVVGGCFSSQQASTRMLGQVLPDVFSTLAGVQPTEGPQLPGPFGNLVGSSGQPDTGSDSGLPGPYENLSSDDR